MAPLLEIENLRTHVKLRQGTVHAVDGCRCMWSQEKRLGLGLAPPATDWGTLLTEGIDNFFNGYWWQLWPAAFLIVATVLAVSVLGDGLRDVAEGRLQRR